MKKQIYLFKYFRQENADSRLQPLYSQEHFLNATELARLFGITTEKGKPAPARMRRIIEAELGEYPRYFYDYGPRLMRVYPVSKLIELCRRQSF